MRRPRFRRWTGSIRCCRCRHGTLSLYAALDVKTGKVHGMTAGRHTSQEFIGFLEGLVARTPWAKQIHVVLDNLSAHKSKDVERFLGDHSRVQFHFTPTYSSWLNQVELWFAKIQREVIARGVFTSVADLGRKLRKYPRLFENSQAVPLDLYRPESSNHS